MPPKPAGLQKRPVQARSRERVDRILDAAAALLGEGGFEVLTTSAVADRANVAVGSLYQFFRDKDDVVAAVVERLSAELDDIVHNRLTAELLAKDRIEFIAMLIDSIAEMQARSSAFVCIFAGAQSDSRFEALAGGLRNILLKRLDTLFEQVFPQLQDKERMRILQVMSEIARALIGAIDRSESSARRLLTAELKIALAAYLNAKVGPNSPAR